MMLLNLQNSSIKEVPHKIKQMQKIVLFFLSIVFFVSAMAQPVIVNIAAAADNSIYQIPNANSNALGQNIFSGTNGGGSPRRGLIKFDIAAVVPAGAIITGASLTLNCNVSRPQADDVNLHKLTSNWGEGISNAGGGSGDGAGAAATPNDATWITNFFPGSNWISQGGDFVAGSSGAVSIGGTGFYTWNTATMVTDVQNWLNTPATNFGWILICNEAVISTARKFGSRENTVIANRPVLSVTYTAALPITLTSFNAIAAANKVTLHWVTEQEINNSHFEILQSNDGILFSNIAKLNGNGTTAVRQTYNFIHTVYSSGNIFYKLAQVDYDGRKTYSTVVKVSVTAFTQGYKPLSNIVTQTIILRNNLPANKTLYKIYNRSGQLLINGGITSNKIDVANLASGLYYLCIYHENKNPEQYQFVKL
jgi:hypothetical protein